MCGLHIREIARLGALHHDRNPLLSPQAAIASNLKEMDFIARRSLRHRALAAADGSFPCTSPSLCHSIDRTAPPLEANIVHETRYKCFRRDGVELASFVALWVFARVVDVVRSANATNNLFSVQWSGDFGPRRPRASDGPAACAGMFLPVNVFEC